METVFAMLAQVPPLHSFSTPTFWAQHTGGLPQVPSGGPCISCMGATSEPSWPLLGHRCLQMETRASSDPTELGTFTSPKENSTTQLWRQDRRH